MLKSVLNQPNVIGRLMIVLLFVGGVVFAGAFDGFVVETEASSCCGGETDASIFSSSECCDEKCTCRYQRCPGSGCSGCGTYNCATFCGSCSCLSFCKNAPSKSCSTKDGTCTVNP